MVSAGRRRRHEEEGEAPDAVCSLSRVKEVVAASQSAEATIVDARSQARFEGTVTEARKNCRSGHAPGSRNLPFTALLKESGEMVSADEIVAAFEGAGVAAPLSAPLIGSCGSGVTSSVLALALAHAGRPQLMECYDGSWAEYGADPSLPLATGPAAPAASTSKKRAREGGGASS